MQFEAAMVDDVLAQGAKKKKKKKKKSNKAAEDGEDENLLGTQQEEIESNVQANLVNYE